MGSGKSVEGVLMRNDLDWIGLHPLISRYACLLAENILTLRSADIMLRVIALITASTDKELAAANEYLKTIEKGEMASVGESAFFSGIKMQSPPSNNGSYLTQFIEYQQYLKGSFFNEIGLSANYNMKREAIGKGESTLDEDALLPLCDNMLTCRREDLAKVNEMFGTDISVEFSSSWLENRIEAISALRDMAGGNSFGNSFGFNAGQPAGIPQPIPDNGETTETAGQPVETSAGGEVGADAPKEVEIESVLGQDRGNTEPENENGDSKINDLSQDEDLTKMLDKASEEPNIALVNQSEVGEENEDAENSTESSEDKGNISTD